jgi:aspartyl protease family protein
MKLSSFVLAGVLALATAAHAQSVALAGMLGSKALVIVDGGTPKGVAVGETHRGVKILSTQGDVAVIEIAGKRHTLRVGDAPASVGGSGGGGASGTKVVLTAGTGGHFVTQGQINGRATQMVVDTGASLVSISAADADRMGLNYKSGQPARLSTANGVTNGWKIKLSSVKLGDVEVYEVDAVVSSGSMPYVLLGNSYLTRFQMTRTNDQMLLEKRF